MKVHVSALMMAVALLSVTTPATAAEKLVISTWGGSFRDLIEENIAAKFKAETGADVEYITGGTIDRLNKAKLAKDNPESDITFTTAHVGWLYVNDGLFENLDLSKIPNAKNLVDQAKVSPAHIGTWGYVYTIGYLEDSLPKGVTFNSWNDLWDPRLKNSISAPDFDPSHLIAVSALLSGGDPAHWEKGEDRLKALKPNFRAFYTDDANSQQLFATGETPVQVVLTMNAYYMKDQGVPITVVIPKEGGVLGIDTVAINKGSKHMDLAYKFINMALDADVQGRIADLKKGSPTVTNAKVSPDVAKLPGVFTTAEQWNKQTINIDPKLRAEDTAVWRKWFAENIIAH
ncbi:MAG: ABC transporter substrate-binding protein [Janthinobacterium lividum]